MKSHFYYLLLFCAVSAATSCSNEPLLRLSPPERQQPQIDGDDGRGGGAIPVKSLNSS